MEWNELIIRTTNEAKEAIANILNDFGANGVVIEEPYILTEKSYQFGELYAIDAEKFTRDGVTIKAYFVQDENWNQLKVDIENRIKELPTFHIDIGNYSLTVQRVKESDWENEWKRYFKPLQVTDRFTIVPTWESYERDNEDELLILMDPGMAFGTGSHATTKLSLIALEKIVKPDDIIIDVGSGSGILSIATCLLGARHVFSYDLDPVAVNSTKYNRDLNELTDKITVRKNDLLKDIHHEEKADVIVANILAHIILQLIDDAKQQLKDRGYFIVSGIIEKESEKITERLLNSDFTIVEKLTEDHWVTLIAQKNDSR